MLLRATAGLAACLATHAVASVTVSLTAPTNGSVHQAGVNVTLSATATASKGYTLSKVEFYQGTTLIGGDTSTAALLHFIHVDHLNTPRLVANQSGQTVWRWDQQEAFGVNVPDENPSGLGGFEFPLRYAGQYFDKETNLRYNLFRDYDPSIARYVESDPIGLEGGLNTYAYVRGNPLVFYDPDGLEVRFICRRLGIGERNPFQHCFVYVTCPTEGWTSTLSLYAGNGLWPRFGYRAANEGPDNPNAPSQFNQPVSPPNQCLGDPCAYEKAIIRRFNSFQSGLVPYSALGPNSNSFAAGLITGNQYGGVLPAGAPGPIVAPGIGMPHPGFRGN
jgi:RHS repeat-associated protein